MPYFKSHNALFIHIPKNAGRSIEAALLPQGVGPDSGRRNWLNRAAHFLQSATASPAAKELLIGTLDRSLVAQHLTYQEIELLRLFCLSDLKRMFRFCIVRNPYERAISSIFHFRDRFFGDLMGNGRVDSAFVEAALERWIEIESEDHNVIAHRRPQSEYVRDVSGHNAMDLTIRMEALEEGLGELARKLGIAEIQIPWIGKNLGKSLDLEHIFSRNSRKAVERAFGEDLEMFGYNFPTKRIRF